MLDAMVIHKGTWWDHKQKCYVGRVDYGTGIPEADDDLATEALVFMISSVTGHWKHPIVYFLQKQDICISPGSADKGLHWLT